MVLSEFQRLTEDEAKMPKVKVLLVGRSRLTAFERQVFEAKFPEGTEFDYRAIAGESAEMPEDPEQWLLRCQLEEIKVVILPPNVFPHLPIRAMREGYVHVTFFPVDGQMDVLRIHIEDSPFAGNSVL